MISVLLRMKIRFRYLLLLFLSAFLFSCSREDILDRINTQESEIEKYVVSLEEVVEVHEENGIWRVVLEKGSGEYSAKVGDSVIFNYSANIFSGAKGALFDTNIKSIAKDADYQPDFSAFTPRERRVGKGDLIKGLDRGLLGVQKGERSYIIFTSEHGYGNHQIGMVPKLSALIYEVWILDVRKK